MTRWRSQLISWLEPAYDRHPILRGALKRADTKLDELRYSIASTFRGAIRPELRSLFISLTADCNLRCKGCRYGRDFMQGQELPLPLVRTLLTDAKTLKFDKVRLYGGEPLMHRELPRIVEHATRIGLNAWVTTNGLLLKDHIDALYEAGLRKITIGFYGIGEQYNTYVSHPCGFELMEEGVAYLRERYGTRIRLGLDWLLMRPTCNLDSLRETFRFAERYGAAITVNLIHYSLPYFTAGEKGELQFTSEDRGVIHQVISALEQFRSIRPDLLPQSLIALRAIPDWLLQGPKMRIPCLNHRLIWVGADGTVQMCYVTFRLGNLHEDRLCDLVFSREHYRAARDAFALNCPNCHCGFDSRTQAFGPTRRLYQQGLDSDGRKGRKGDRFI
jgi:MoaA/NifB/PqqE/SkfB family radical SAM enzyme